ncbi:hypothetical protein [Erwinia sp. PsM31]|uniref:hypothetical protein n=1 Tax=Erwinia sp. PsM31 TaxID=3030535 RepID=UPI00263A4892|nr:hypothetical protein [Erwinia sp. PsM31]MDN4626279.1 hypothetical protein [Erwinia sp. PsM31]
MTTREISSELWGEISGGNANSNYEGNSGSKSHSSSASRNNYNGIMHYSYINGVPDSCVENILGGATLGALGGTPATVAVGAVAGSFTGGCWRPNGNGGGGGTGSNNNCSGGSECSW